MGGRTKDGETTCQSQLPRTQVLIKLSQVPIAECLCAFDSRMSSPGVQALGAMFEASITLAKSESSVQPRRHRSDRGDENTPPLRA